MFKIGLENRDFCKSLHFYIVDAEKKKKKKKKKTSCICWLVQLLSALRAMPSLFVFLVLRGACQRPDSGRWKKKKKKKKKKKTSCICWLVQLLSALRAEDIAFRAMPSLFVFLVLRGACQRPDIVCKQYFTVYLHQPRPYIHIILCIYYLNMYYKI